MTDLHQPVLLDAVIDRLSPQPGEILVDGTFGAGGYTRRLLEAGATIIAFDRDPTAIAAGRSLERECGDALTLVEAPFSALAEHVAPPINGVVFDFGVSSMQLDRPERGFSFRAEGPLDMRMGAGRPAADFVNQAEEAALADVFYHYGEERRSRALARRIVAQRETTPFETTAQLAAVAEAVLGTRDKIHPATRMFQALRILVNDELGEIVRALIAAEKVLAEGGRLVAVSFHSLEDRIVKRFFQVTEGRAQTASRHEPPVDKILPRFAPLGKALSADEAEIAGNPRARSARLRAGVRTAAPPTDWTEAALAQLGLPALVFSPLQDAWRPSP